MQKIHVAAHSWQKPIRLFCMCTGGGRGAGGIEFNQGKRAAEFTEEKKGLTLIFNSYNLQNTVALYPDLHLLAWCVSWSGS